MDKTEEMLKNLGQRKDLGQMENETLLPDEKQRIMKLTLEKINSEQEKTDKKVLHWTKRIGTVAAAILAVVVLAVGGKAVVAHLDLDDTLKDRIGATDPASSKLAKKLVTMPEASDIVKGTEVAVTQVVGDNTGFTAVLKVKNPPRYEGYLEFEQTDLDAHMDEVTWNDAAMTKYGDKELTFFLRVNASDMTGKQMDVKLTNYGYHDDNGRFVTLVKGTWNLSWKLDYKNEETVTKVDQPMIWKDGSQATFRSVSMTPLSVTVHFDITKQNDHKLSQKLSDKLQSDNRLVVEYVDGKRIDSRFPEYARAGEYDEYYDRATLQFASITDPNEIASVTFSGHKVEFRKPVKVQRQTIVCKKTGFVLTVPVDYAKMIKVKESKEKGISKAYFEGTIKGVKMPLLTIYRLKGMYSPDQIEEINPMSSVLGFHDGYTYTVEFGEISTEEQLTYFVDIMNNETVHLLPFFEYYDE